MRISPSLTQKKLLTWEYFRVTVSIRHLNLLISSQESSSFMMPSFSVMRIDQLLMKTTFWHEHPRNDVKTRIKILSQFSSHQHHCRLHRVCTRYCDSGKSSSSEQNSWKLHKGRFMFDTFLGIERIVIVKLGMRQLDWSLNLTS